MCDNKESKYKIIKTKKERKSGVVKTGNQCKSDNVR